MNNANNETSEVKQAIDNADAQQIEENLQHDKQKQVPESLSKTEETPFIDDKDRTDK